MDRAAYEVGRLQVVAVNIVNHLQPAPYTILAQSKPGSWWRVSVCLTSAVIKFAVES